MQCSTGRAFGRRIIALILQPEFLSYIFRKRTKNSLHRIEAKKVRALLCVIWERCNRLFTLRDVRSARIYVVASGSKVPGMYSISPNPHSSVADAGLTKGTCECVGNFTKLCASSGPHSALRHCTAYVIRWAGKQRKQRDEKKRTTTKSPPCQRAGGRASDVYARRGTSAVCATVDMADVVCCACKSYNVCFL